MMNSSLSIGSFPSQPTYITSSISVSALTHSTSHSFIPSCSLFSYAALASLAFIRPFWKRLHAGTPRKSVTITSAPGPVSNLVRSLPSLGSPNAGFEPAWWLPGGDMQTVFCSMGNFEAVDRIQYQRKFIRVPDGGTIALDFCAASGATDVSPIAVVLHGLTGGSHEHYIRALMTDLTSANAGFRAVVVNGRGCAGAPVTSPQLYHGGTTDDLRHALLYIRSQFPSAPLMGVGFSVGANMLAKYLGEEGSSSALCAGVCLANVWDFAAGIEHMENGNFMQRYVYNNALGSAQQALYRSASYALQGVSNRWRLPEVFGASFCGMRWIDDRVASQMAGCKDAKDYYERNSSSQFLSGVKVPLLGLNACDDPIASKTIPYKAASSSEYFVLATTEGGGHLGWFTQENGKLKRWYTRPVVEFLTAIAVNQSTMSTPTAVVSNDGLIYDAIRPEFQCREISETEIPADIWHPHRTYLNSFRPRSLDFVHPTVAMYLVRGIVTAATAPYQIYKDLNPSTLTGAIDVIVVERRAENGETELACSPFHVRFGKWQVLLPADKKVSVYVNGKPMPFNMKIGEAGEAFFVFETDEDVPEELMTSPILEPVRPGQESRKLAGSGRLIGRFGTQTARAKDENALLGDALVSGDEGSKTGVTSDQEPEFLDLSNPSAPRGRGYSPTPSLSPPMSTSTLETATLPASTPPTEHGSLPRSFLSKAFNATKAAAHITAEEIEEKKDAAYDLLRYSKGSGGIDGVDPSDGVDEEEALKLREAAQPPEIRYGHNVVLDMAGYHSKSQAVDESSTEPESSPSQPRRPSLSKAKPHSDMTLSPRSVSHAPFTRGSSEPPERIPVTQDEYSWEWGAMPKLSSDSQLGGSPSASTIRGNSSPNLPTIPLAEPRTPPSNIIGLGHPSRINPRPESRPVSDSDSLFGNGGTLVVENDDENEQISMEHNGIKRLTFELSLCGDSPSSLDPPEAAKQFLASKITLQRLLEDPSTVHSEKLIIRWDEKYISRTDGTPLFDALVAWRDNTLAQQLSAASNSRNNTPRGRSSWLWWGRSRSDRPGTIDNEGARATERPMLSDPPSAPAGLDLDGASNRAASPISPTSENESETTPNKHYVKTLRLTSEQLKSLDLKKGANSITFSLSSGVVACTARIFLWDAHDHIVISDIDGTITKSDALGHVFTMIGRDWTHLGVAKLYTDIARNGYKIMYLTSRAIGQADSTRDYLKGIKQNNFQLPEGPVIMSPDRLMASLHREVIMRKPEVFKMACLRDIQRLFGNEYRNPFYAGFGNRITDALSYRSVNVPSDRIFTIDSSGEVKMELLELAGYKSSYIHMTDLVDQMFPPVHRRWAPEYTDFNFWRAPLPEIELPDLSPPSPALSAHSNTSGGSRLGRLVSLGRSASRASSIDARQAEKDVRSLGDTERRRTTSHPGTIMRAGTANVRPSSPLTGPAMSAEDLDVISDAEGRMQGGVDIDREHRRRKSFDSMPGSFEERRWVHGADEEDSDELATQDDAFDDEGEDGDEGDDEHDDDEDDDDEEPQFDTLATDEMEDTPFL
ncbi:LNS2 protein, partial [Rhizoctonia solani]